MLLVERLEALHQLAYRLQDPLLLALLNESLQTHHLLPDASLSILIHLACCNCLEKQKS